MSSKLRNNLCANLSGARVRVLCAMLLFVAVFSFHTKAMGWQEPATLQLGANGVYYAESWKKGSRHIQEQKFHRRLDAHDPSFEAVLNESSGSHQYRLLIDPIYYVRDAWGKLKFKNEPTIPRSKVNFWDVKLLEPDQEVSLLMVNRDQGDFIDQRNTLARLDPVEDLKGYMVGIFGVPISSKRVIKVEGFYCVISVLNYQLNQKQRAFEWLVLEITFTNSKPEIVDRALR